MQLEEKQIMIVNFKIWTRTFAARYVYKLYIQLFLRMNSPKEIEGRLVKPVYYVVAIDNMGNMKVCQYQCQVRIQGSVPRAKGDLKFSIELIFQIILKTFFILIFLVSDVPFMSQIQKTSLDPVKFRPDPGLQVQTTEDRRNVCHQKYENM